MRRTLLLLAIPAVLIVGALAPATAASADSAPYRVLPASPRGEQAVHEVTAVMVAPEGVDRNFTRDDVVAALQEDDAFYQSETNGFISVQTVSVSDWVQPDDPSISCKDPDAIVTFARQYANWKPGLDRDFLAIVPDGTQCAYTNSGTLSGALNDGGVMFVSSASPSIIAHELGHTFSLAHESSVQCADSWDFDASQGLPSSCTRLDYGNYSDVMGSSYNFYAFSAGSLDRLGLIQNRVVPACGDARRISIQTLSAGYDAQRIISWQDPYQPSVTYYVQYRDAIDASQYDSLWVGQKVERESGVQIMRTDPQMPAGGSILVRPGDDSASKELAADGETVPLNDGMSVSVVGLDEDAHVATVDVTVPCGADGQTVTTSAPTGTASDAATSRTTETSGMSGMASMPDMKDMPRSPQTGPVDGAPDAAAVLRLRS